MHNSSRSMRSHNFWYKTYFRCHDFKYPPLYVNSSRKWRQFQGVFPPIYPTFIHVRVCQFHPRMTATAIMRLAYPLNDPCLRVLMCGRSLPVTVHQGQKVRVSTLVVKHPYPVSSYRATCLKDGPFADMEYYMEDVQFFFIN